jgi:phospholipid/cholesterol/gamma-HCH transport system ATP-binding protein
MSDQVREFDEHGMSRQEILDAIGAPVVVFDKVSLAFDEKVILREVSFTLIKGHTKIILGASGAGKSTILKLITGLLRPDAGVIWVNGERVDQMSELEMMRVRADLGMVFQEGALFDSLTGPRERRLQAVGRAALARTIA